MSSKLCLPEEALICPVCCDFYKDPVLLPCGDSFCLSCLQARWTPHGPQECPVCPKLCAILKPPRNRALKSMCEAFLQERSRRASVGSEVFCSLHGEKLTLFCLGEKQPVCHMCQVSKQHSNHIFLPVNKAAATYKKCIGNSMKQVYFQQECFSYSERHLAEAAKHIKVQARHTEGQIKEEFKKLHQFLQEEEEARLAALRQEEEQKSLIIKEKTEAISRDVSTLSDTIRAIEEELKADNISFIKNYEATMKRTQLTLPDPSRSGVLIDVAKHLGNLSFRVWEKMQEIVSYTPVIFDPNTANRNLTLSEDLTSVRYREEEDGEKDTEELPHNPERFAFHLRVQASEGLTSGRHSWDVQVGDSDSWEVGVLTESIYRGDTPNGRLWMVQLCNSDYTSSTCDDDRPLSVKQSPKRIRVLLDLDDGEMLFTDPDTNTLLCHFKDSLIKTKTVFPFIKTACTQPIRILPEVFQGFGIGKS